MNKVVSFDKINELFNKEITNSLGKYKNYVEFLNQNRYNNDVRIKTMYHPEIQLLFCDATASGSPLKIVEKFLEIFVYPVYSNTHSNNVVGRLMSSMINESKKLIMKSVNGDCKTYKILFSGNGATGAVNHLVHLLKPKLNNSVVFVSVTEHYSNILPWYENAKKLVIIDVDDNGLVDIDKLKEHLKEHKKEGYDIICSFSACSNVTGTIQPIRKLSKMVHDYGGIIFFDYAASAPYSPVDLIGDNLDAIFCSVHKFPGGPGGSGVLILKESISCNNEKCFLPGGGTISYMFRNNGKIDLRYSNDIETRESGGTPPILGIIKAGIVFAIKDYFQEEIINHELSLTRKFQGYLDYLYFHFR